jgi:hypothetical protein
VRLAKKNDWPDKNEFCGNMITNLHNSMIFLMKISTSGIEIIKFPIVPQFKDKIALNLTPKGLCVFELAEKGDEKSSCDFLFWK